MMCSLAIARPSSAEAAGDVVLGPLDARLREDALGLADLNDLAKIHEGGVIGGARRLLHVVGDDDDAVVRLQLADQLLDLLRRDRIERRGRLVEEQDLGLDGDGAGDAEPLLLPAREAEPALPQLVLDLVPQRSTAQRPLDAILELAFWQSFVKADSEGDVVGDRHRKWRRLLEDHA